MSSTLTFAPPGGAPRSSGASGSKRNVRTVTVAISGGRVAAMQCRNASIAAVTSLRWSGARRQRHGPRTILSAESSLASASFCRLNRKSAIARSMSNGSPFGSVLLPRKLIASWNCEPQASDRQSLCPRTGASASSPATTVTSKPSTRPEQERKRSGVALIVRRPPVAGSSVRITIQVYGGGLPSLSDTVPLNAQSS